MPGTGMPKEFIFVSVLKKFVGMVALMATEEESV